jgi:hypothetical protein
MSEEELAKEGIAWRPSSYKEQYAKDWIIERKK